MKAVCTNCGFELWLPIAELKVSTLSLYSDGRFPGRAILSLKEHFESLEELPPTLALDFLLDSQIAMGAIRRATGSPRVNYAVLGNAVAHVHAHLIPRYPESETKPHSSPWDDPRPRTKLEMPRESSLIGAIRNELESQ